MVDMPDDTILLTIGELARLTGLTVKTIRYWSDEGLVPPTDRTPPATGSTVPTRCCAWAWSVRCATSTWTSRPCTRCWQAS